MGETLTGVVVEPTFWEALQEELRCLREDNTNLRGKIVAFQQAAAADGERIAAKNRRINELTAAYDQLHKANEDLRRDVANLTRKLECERKLTIEVARIADQAKKENAELQAAAQNASNKVELLRKALCVEITRVSQLQQDLQETKGFNTELNAVYRALLELLESAGCHFPEGCHILDTVRKWLQSICANMPSTCPAFQMTTSLVQQLVARVNKLERYVGF